MKKLLLFFLILFSSLALVSQNQTSHSGGTLNGVVVDNNSEPVIGASVFIKGTSIGTITDLDGSFSIKVKSFDILVISYTGFISKEITLSEVSEKGTILMTIDLTKTPEELYSPTEYEIVTVYYGTDRTYDKNKKKAKKYLNKHNRNESINWGKCEISIPSSHDEGEIERPYWWQRVLGMKENPNSHIIIRSVDQVEKFELLEDLNNELQGTIDCSLLVYIHGYNNSFEDAAFRTAQLSYDLGFKGRSIFYSWPSEKEPLKYPVDVQTAAWTQSNFKSFLFDLLENTSYSNIYLVAHSMGNQVYQKGLADLITERPEQISRIKEIILAAPDIDVDLFKRDVYPILSRLKAGITLYASSKDKALKVSNEVNGGSRLGDSGRKITILPNIETIDASEVKTDFIGHAVFAESSSIITDMYYLIEKNLRAAKRDHLIRRILDDKEYFLIK